MYPLIISSCNEAESKRKSEEYKMLLYFLYTITDNKNVTTYIE